MTNQYGDRTATSTGQPMTDSGFLDAHFEADRPEYEAALRSVGVQPGWQVLDAGCGGGSFLPLLAELVGPTGQVRAVDVAPENVLRAQARLAGTGAASLVTVEEGSLLALPFPDHTFDAAWCANVLMYLSDVDLPRALAELCRVVRPGGLVAAKEGDSTLWQPYPSDLEA